MTHQATDTARQSDRVLDSQNAIPESTGLVNRGNINVCAVKM